MNELIGNIVRSFSDETKRILSDNLVAEYLFGSVTRDEADESSDIDILVIVKRFDYQIRRELSRLSSEYSIRHGVCISPIIKDVGTWERNKFCETLFYRKIQQGGIRLC